MQDSWSILLPIFVPGHFFTAVELAGFAHELDEDEGARMAEGGITSPEFLRFMQVLIE